jgi:hypothetical protein
MSWQAWAALALVALVLLGLFVQLVCDHNRLAGELANVWRILDRASLDNNRDPKSGKTMPELWARAVQAQADAQELEREERAREQAEHDRRLGSGGR